MFVDKCGRRVYCDRMAHRAVTDPEAVIESEMGDRITVRMWRFNYRWDNVSIDTTSSGDVVIYADALRPLIAALTEMADKAGV